MNDYSEMKKCVICGKEYEPYAGQARRQKTCSPECRKILNRMHDKEYKSLECVRESHKLYMRRYNIRRRNPVCTICGKPLIRDYSTGHTARTRMHDECVYIDVVNTLKAGKPLNTAQYQRLVSRGYDMQSFREDWLS